MAPDTPALRADAQQNRDRLLRVAYDALRESPDTSLNSIAKRAGVGIGTLYRHFPTRDALLLAVYRREVEQAAEAAPALLEEHPGEPLRALREWMDRLVRSGMTKVGMAEVMHRVAAHESLAAESYQPIVGALISLLQACEAAGAIRPGVDPDDVLLLLSATWRIDPASDWRARADRMLDVLIDGLTVGATTA